MEKGIYKENKVVSAIEFDGTWKSLIAVLEFLNVENFVVNKHDEYYVVRFDSGAIAARGMMVYKNGYPSEPEKIRTLNIIEFNNNHEVVIGR